MAPSDATSAPDPDGAARPRGAKHSVTARTKARRRAVEILFEADQRGLLRALGPDADAPEAAATGECGAAGRLREFAAERAVHSANHTEAPAYTREILSGVADHLAECTARSEANSRRRSAAPPEPGAPSHPCSRS